MTYNPTTWELHNCTDPALVVIEALKERAEILDDMARENAIPSWTYQHLQGQINETLKSIIHIEMIGGDV